MLVYDSNRTVPAIVHAVPLGLRICSCHALHAVPETLEDTMMQIGVQKATFIPTKSWIQGGSGDTFGSFSGGFGEVLG